MASQTPTRSLIDFSLPVNGSGTRIARDMLLFLFSLITAGSPDLFPPSPFFPVPITGQTLAVLLAGRVSAADEAQHQWCFMLLRGNQLDVFAGGSNAAGDQLQF
ncbi:MAG: hypothetical protein CM1200mP22_25610 [Dehalococcoidia bacterium]|nr:MAG: hypothetical protein CM1200mP22_25610 [Dehalococcoidia bacterium]